jgi:hypothetical protein
MFYKRKYYIVKTNSLRHLINFFNEINLPNQLKHGSWLVDRWMVPHSETATEVFAVWEYDSYEEYQEIESRVRSDNEHLYRIKKRFEKHGGRDRVYKEYIWK